MDRASLHHPATGTRRSPRRDTWNPDGRRARRALPPIALKLHNALPPRPFAQSRRDARPCRFPARTGRLSLARPGTICARRDYRRFPELEHEAIGLTAMLEHNPVAIVFRVAQRARSSVQPEARLLHILD